VAGLRGLSWRTKACALAGALVLMALATLHAVLPDIATMRSSPADVKQAVSKACNLPYSHVTDLRPAGAGWQFTCGYWPLGPARTANIICTDGEWKGPGAVEVGVSCA
jgi:hypothetical protein